MMVSSKEATVSAHGGFLWLFFCNSPAFGSSVFFCQFKGKRFSLFCFSSIPTQKFLSSNETALCKLIDLYPRSTEHAVQPCNTKAPVMPKSQLPWKFRPGSWVFFFFFFIYFFHFFFLLLFPLSPFLSSHLPLFLSYPPISPLSSHVPFLSTSAKESDVSEEPSIVSGDGFSLGCPPKRSRSLLYCLLSIKNHCLCRDSTSR